MLTRKSTFLATREWKTIPWSTSSTKKDIVQYILDEALAIPAYLEEYDRFRRVLKSSAPGTDAGSLQMSISCWITKIEQGLYDWYECWVENYPNGQPWERIPQGEGAFPIFCCRNNSKSIIIVPTILIYPDLKLALALCMYYAIILILSANDPRDTILIGPKEQYDIACRICRSMEFCFQTFPGQSVNRLGFPLRVAYSFLPEGVEKQYVERLCRFIAKSRNIRWWENMEDIFIRE